MAKGNKDQGGQDGRERRRRGFAGRVSSATNHEPLFLWRQRVEGGGLWSECGGTGSEPNRVLDAEVGEDKEWEEKES